MLEITLKSYLYLYYFNNVKLPKIKQHFDRLIHDPLSKSIKVGINILEEIPLLICEVYWKYMIENVSQILNDRSRRTEEHDCPILSNTYKLQQHFMLT